jgi:hypothetical protein
MDDILNLLPFLYCVCIFSIDNTFRCFVCLFVCWISVKQATSVRLAYCCCCFFFLLDYFFGFGFCFVCFVFYVKKKEVKKTNHIQKQYDTMIDLFYSIRERVKTFIGEAEYIALPYN